MTCDHVGAARYTSLDGGSQICFRCGEPIESSDAVTSPESGKNLARKTDPATSKAAAWMNPGRRNSQRWRLAEAFRRASFPMTWEQAGQTAAVASAWKRISELHERGIIEVVGTGKTSFGAKAQMYRITDDGRVALGGTR